MVAAENNEGALPNYVVTFHSAWSYGACLQAYATLEAMAALGKRFEILNYISPYAKHKNAFDLLKGGSLKQAAVTAVKDVVFRRTALHKKAFGGFRNRIAVTDVLYTDVSQLGAIKADILMSGSDQIWNPQITGGLDPVFFLQFGSCRKRVSVASSLGSYSYTPEEAARVKTYLGTYDRVSVREAHAQREIGAATGSQTFRCLDPTLLLDTAYWRAFARKPEGFSGDERYVLVFNLAKRPVEEERAWRKFADDAGLPLWRISNNTHKDSVFDRLLLGMTPEEFVWLVDHAQFVITDSFHGTAFSVNMNTPFAAFAPVFGNSARIADLLALIGMDERLLDGACDLARFAQADFSAANAALADERGKCNAWIADALR